MRNRKIIGKKGMAMDDVIEMLIMVAVVIGLAIFIVIVISDHKEKENAANAQLEKEKVTAAEDLIAYLNAEDESGERNADVFARHYNQSNIEDMGQSFDKFFDPIYFSAPDQRSWRSWKISVYNPEGNEVFMQEGERQMIYIGGVSTVFLAEVHVPIPSGGYATIKLYKVGMGDSLGPTG